MKNLINFGVSMVISSSIILTGCQEQNNTKEMSLPFAKKKKKELTIHDHTRIDNYFWLNDRENPKVIEYLNAENDYTKEKLKHTEQLQSDLYKEIIGRIKQTDVSVPYFKNGYFYYSRQEEGKEYSIFCRKKESLDNPEEILLDENQRAEGKSYYSSTGVNVSPNNELGAFAEDTVSRRLYTIRFKNLTTGEILPDELKNATGGVAWTNDNKTIFYTLKDTETLRSFKIFKHKLGTSQDEDVEIFHEKDDTFGTYAMRSKSGKYIIIGSYSTMESEYQILSTDNPDGNFTMFEPRGNNHEYDITHIDDKFYIRTNNNAKNFRLMVTNENQTAMENWKEVIPHREDVLLEDMDVFENHLVLDERFNGLTQLQVINLQTNEAHYLDFGEETYMSYISYNPNSKTNIIRYGYSSLTTPNSVYEYNMDDKTKTLLKQQEVVGDFDPTNYEAERLYVKARDGVTVPVSLVYKKGFKKDGNAPLLLYSYGSYGSSSEAYFSSSRLSLLDRGFAFAIAHIRGGEEMGRHWYEDGKLLKKKNTFYDFIDCAKHLINENYTNPDKLCIMGGSAGGLLMGAVVNMEPQLFKAVVAAVPFVDVVTTMLDESIPLTTGEYDEWGNPNDKEYYDYMLSYSPYDNVTNQEYPNMLVTTGLHDSQVQYWEPAKWVAKLRDMKMDDNLLLLHINMDAGHGGASGRFEMHKETALEYAFLLDMVGR